MQLDQLPGTGQIVAHMLGRVGADGDAGSAIDAHLGNDSGVGVPYLDRLDRALAHAFVAILTLVLFGVDWAAPIHRAPSSLRSGDA